MNGRIAKSYLLLMLVEMQAAGSWCGETHLQKCTYLLRELEGVKALPFEFIMYKHGPYSFDLHDAISDLESSYFIIREATPPYGSHIRITPLGEKYIQQGHNAELVDRETLSAIAARFSSLSVADLEKYSTAAYVFAEMPNASVETQVQRLIELKPHVNKNEAQESLLQILSYVQNKKSNGVAG